MFKERSQMFLVPGALEPESNEAISTRLEQILAGHNNGSSRDEGMILRRIGRDASGTLDLGQVTELVVSATVEHARPPLIERYEL